MKEKVFLGLIGVIAVAGLVLMFSSSQGSTGEFFFETNGLGQSVDCKDLCSAFSDKIFAFKKESNRFPSDKLLKAEYENIKNLGLTYVSFTDGLRRFEYRGKRNCLLFYELARLAGVRNVFPEKDVTFCCQR